MHSVSKYVLAKITMISACRRGIRHQQQENIKLRNISVVHFCSSEFQFNHTFVLFDLNKIIDDDDFAACVEEQLHQPKRLLQEGHVQI